MKTSLKRLGVGTNLTLFCSPSANTKTHKTETKKLRINFCTEVRASSVEQYKLEVSATYIQLYVI